MQTCTFLYSPSLYSISLWKNPSPKEPIVDEPVKGYGTPKEISCLLVYIQLKGVDKHQLT